MGVQALHYLETSLSIPKANFFGHWENNFLNSLKNQENVLIPYYIAIKNLRNALLDQNAPSLHKLTKSYIEKSLIPLITFLILNLNEYKGDDDVVESVINNLRRARVQLNTAVELFDSKKDPALIYGKNNALSEAEKELSKALNNLCHIRDIIERLKS